MSSICCGPTTIHHLSSMWQLCTCFGVSDQYLFSYKFLLSTLSILHATLPYCSPIFVVILQWECVLCSYVFFCASELSNALLPKCWYSEWIENFFLISCQHKVGASKLVLSNVHAEGCNSITDIWGNFSLLFYFSNNTFFHSLGQLYPKSEMHIFLDTSCVLTLCILTFACCIRFS